MYVGDLSKRPQQSRQVRRRQVPRRPAGRARPATAQTTTTTTATTTTTSTTTTNEHYLADVAYGDGLGLVLRPHAPLRISLQLQPRLSTGTAAVSHGLTCGCGGRTRSHPAAGPRSPTAGRPRRRGMRRGPPASSGTPAGSRTGCRGPGCRPAAGCEHVLAYSCSRYHPQGLQL